MARVGISIHTEISGIWQVETVPGSLVIDIRDKNDSYSDVTFFTGDPAFAAHMVAAYKSYQDKLKAEEIEARERDNIANGQDVDEPETEDE